MKTFANRVIQMYRLRAAAATGLSPKFLRATPNVTSRRTNNVVESLLAVREQYVLFVRV